MLQAATPNLLQKNAGKSRVEPWKGVCSSRCYMAKTDKKKCKCRCKGEHHSKGRIKQEANTITKYLNQEEPT